MAKTRRRTQRTRGNSTPRVSTARVSTRRLGRTGETPEPQPAAAPAMRARGAARAETLHVTLELRDIIGRLIRDPETFFTFRRLSDNRQIGDQLQLELAGQPATFELPVATGDVAVCEIDPRRYRFVHSPVFFRSPGPPIRKETRVFREPEAWAPRFTRWSDLPPAFDDLKRVLRGSQKTTLFNGVEPLADLLVEDAYDNLAGEMVTPAKTALLNAYFRLNSTVEPLSGRTWFSFVSRLIAIGRERFLAFVELDMERLVRNIHTHIDEFRADYERTPAENHRGNVPAALRDRITSMISIKSAHVKGNFQLTLAHLSTPDAVLLDVDIDESGDLLRHTLDVFKHKFTGGTHPHDIHELLVLQEGSRAGFDLGYELV